MFNSKYTRMKEAQMEWHWRKKKRLRKKSTDFSFQLNDEVLNRDVAFILRSLQGTTECSQGATKTKADKGAEE